ncbi:hypothetical protein [Phenylobacterium sp.]|uniref:hypothetical protein n=1 Tax=Phenylobacterium sp. TaxID=1871053 RepID=UPI0028A04EBD|nr:hypothetical protein [Phenylobacterium sp.]
MRRLAALGLSAAVLSAAALGACAPGAPEGVRKAVLDQAVSDAIGDPGTCVLIADQGKVVYQYGTHVVCGRTLPTCEGPGVQSLDQLLKKAAGERRTASCRSNADGTRIVAWASGPIEGRERMTFAAVMEASEAPPGIVVADKLASAFARAGLGPKQPSPGGEGPAA